MRLPCHQLVRQSTSCRLFLCDPPPPPLMRCGIVAIDKAVIPAQAGIQGRVTGFGALDSRFRGNDANREVGEPKYDCPALKGAGKNWEPPTLARTPIQPVP